MNGNRKHLHWCGVVVVAILVVDVERALILHTINKTQPTLPCCLFCVCVRVFVRVVRKPPPPLNFVVCVCLCV